MKDQDEVEGLMNEAWQKSGDIGEYEMYRNVSDTYNFKAENQFLTHENPF
jgi:hypothetical protein